MRSWGRLPPAGGTIGLAPARTALVQREPARLLEQGLRGLLGSEAISLHASGREALRVALVHLAARSGRHEVAVPAYTCFSVPAAAVAAGLEVRLVDVTPGGRIDPASAAKLPLARVAALVVGNLFGLPEPLEPLREALRGSGTALVDDAAQSLGAASPEGPVGGRGELGVLSFARGKPLAALGGGALAWSEAPDPALLPAPPRPRRARALVRAALYDLALAPWAFGALSALPGLGVGESVYDPAFARGGIDGASLALAAALLPDLAGRCAERAERARAMGRRLREETAFSPLLADAASRGVYPRLAVVAPSARARDAALAELGDVGAGRLYPSALDRVPALRPHLVGSPACSGAAELSARLLTLPTHTSLAPDRWERVVRTLARLD